MPNPSVVGFSLYAEPKGSWVQLVYLTQVWLGADTSWPNIELSVDASWPNLELGVEKT